MIKVLSLQMNQMTFKVDKLESENSVNVERINSLMKICQLQQKFQENWEEEQEGLKKYVDERVKQEI